MTKLILCLSIAISFFVRADSQPFEIIRYISSPLEGDARREVKMQSVILKPGGVVPFHTHPGDQWTVVEEGDVTVVIKGQPKKVLRPGESVFMARGTVHRSLNETKKATRTIETLILDKDKPPIQFDKNGN
jgi:quercetin dioxygenase-like cupin family protein